MDFQSLINSRFSIGTAMLISRTLPARFGYWLADRVADLISSRKNSKMVQVLRANLWVVSDYQYTAVELDQITRQVFRSTGHCLFDFYRTLDRPKQILKMVEFSPQAQTCFRRINENKPTVFVSAHLSNFDLVGQALGLSGFRFQILSYPQPGNGYKWQNDLRSKAGLDITPTSLDALRKARKRLRAGGSVLTGLDRPLSDSKYKPRFFGRPSPVPVAYIRLALEENAPVVVVAPFTKPDGSYVLMSSDPVVMQPHADLQTEMLMNAEAVLHEAEMMIKKAPDQWSMFYPVWPDVLGKVP
jgi:phosphatidylinositol dimannoside acyltransferase